MHDCNLREDTVHKRQFLKNIAAIGAGTAAGLLSENAPARAETEDDDSIAGLWQMEVAGKAGTYHYFYSISGGTWVATGDIDESYQGFKYSPTVGSYARNAVGSYSYSERGWVFDLKGNKVGYFRSDGKFTLSADGRSFQGPGAFQQFDLKNRTVFREPFSAKATKLTG
jgi:hypothetical protein